MVRLESAFDLSKCARPNILALKPYRCARDDYKNDGVNVLLDANENAYGPSLALAEDGKLLNAAADTVKGEGTKTEVDLLGLNRYPDPHQEHLKQLLCDLRSTQTHTKKKPTPDNLFVGVGSDEAIDNLIRAFCRPGQDRILTCPPTYGMYAVSAQVNDVEVVHVPLDVEETFAVQPRLINEKLASDPSIKLVYLCSPGNPTANRVKKEAVQAILEHPTWNGVVILDEAYIDFSPDGASLAEWVTEWPNLVVMQTLSKAFGLAGIRLGAAFTSPEIAKLLNSLKAPYNVSSPTSQLAIQTLGSIHHLDVMRQNRARIIAQRDRLVDALPKIHGIGRFRGGFDANFLLFEILDRPGGKPCTETALKVYEGLADNKSVVVRFRGKEYGCEGCIRATVGTEKEVDIFLKQIEAILKELYAGKANMNGDINGQEAKKANGAIP